MVYSERKWILSTINWIKCYWNSLTVPRALKLVLCFIFKQRESVQLALRLLDEAEIRGYKLHVEVAKFQLKGEYDASKKKKKCKDYKKKLSQQQKFVSLISVKYCLNSKAVSYELLSLECNAESYAESEVSPDSKQLKKYPFEGEELLN